MKEWAYTTNLSTNQRPSERKQDEAGIPRSLLILFAKSPTARHVKTRLKNVLTQKERGCLQEAFILDTLLLTARLPVKRAIACMPDIHDPFFTRCEKEHATLLIRQEGADLGERMKNAFCWGFSLGFKRVVLIGSDSPTLPIPFIEEAFTQLATVPIVLGPAIDGGYYLIGEAPRKGKALPDLFSGIKWGSKTVLLESLRRLHGMAHHLLPFWYDVDRPSDLAFLKEHLYLLKSQRVPFAKATWKVLNKVMT